MEGLEFTLSVWQEWALHILEVSFNFRMQPYNMAFKEKMKRGLIVIVSLKILTIALISDEILKSGILAISLKVSLFKSLIIRVLKSKFN